MNNNGWLLCVRNDRYDLWLLRHSCHSGWEHHLLWSDLICGQFSPSLATRNISSCDSITAGLLKLYKELKLPFTWGSCLHADSHSVGLTWNQPRYAFLTRLPDEADTAMLWACKTVICPWRSKHFESFLGLTPSHFVTHSLLNFPIYEICSRNKNLFFWEEGTFSGQ